VSASLVFLLKINTLQNALDAINTTWWRASIHWRPSCLLTLMLKKFLILIFLQHLFLDVRVSQMLSSISNVPWVLKGCKPLLDRPNCHKYANFTINRYFRAMKDFNLQIDMASFAKGCLSVVIFNTYIKYINTVIVGKFKICKWKYT
jgi:hypothetical protein